MAIKFITTKDANRYVKIFIYGPSGVGKTRLISTAPNPVVISTEKRLMSLQQFDIPGMEVESPRDFEEAYNIIAADSQFKGCQTVCIDSISDIAETAIDFFQRGKSSKGNKIHGQEAYAKLGDFMLPLIKKFRDLPGKHVYFISKVLAEQDGKSELVYYRPLIPGRILKAQLPHLFDLVLFMQEAEDSQKARKSVLYTQNSLQWNAKDHSGRLDPIESPHLGAIFQKALGQKPNRAKESSEEKNSISIKEDLKSIQE
jgi:hypothetical protein